MNTKRRVHIKSFYKFLKGFIIDFYPLSPSLSSSFIRFTSKAKINETFYSLFSSCRHSFCALFSPFIALFPQIHNAIFPGSDIKKFQQKKFKVVHCCDIEFIARHLVVKEEEDFNRILTQFIGVSQQKMNDVTLILCAVTLFGMSKSPSRLRCKILKGCPHLMFKRIYQDISFISTHVLCSCFSGNNLLFFMLKVCMFT